MIKYQDLNALALDLASELPHLSHINLYLAIERVASDRPRLIEKALSEGKIAPLARHLTNEASPT